MNESRFLDGHSDRDGGKMRVRADTISRFRVRNVHTRV